MHFENSESKHCTALCNVRVEYGVVSLRRFLSELCLFLHYSVGSDTLTRGSIPGCSRTNSLTFVRSSRWRGPPFFLCQNEETCASETFVGMKMLDFAAEYLQSYHNAFCKLKNYPSWAGLAFISCDGLSFDRECDDLIVDLASKRCTRIPVGILHSTVSDDPWIGLGWCRISQSSSRKSSESWALLWISQIWPCRREWEVASPQSPIWLSSSKLCSCDRELCNW